MLDGETRWRGSDVDLRTSSCTAAHVGVRWCTGERGGGARRRPRPELFGRHLDVVTLQAVVELKPREAEELAARALCPWVRWSASMMALRSSSSSAMEAAGRTGSGDPGGRIGSAVAEWRGERR